MFPGALQKTVFSLALGQLTFIGYLFTRKALFQGLFLFPLPFATIWIMKFFDENYASKFLKVRCFLALVFWLIFLTLPLLSRVIDAVKLGTRTRV